MVLNNANKNNLFLSCVQVLHDFDYDVHQVYQKKTREI